MEETQNECQDQPQLSLRSFFVGTMCIAVYVVLLLNAEGKIVNESGAYIFSCFLAGLISTGLMVTDIARNRARRIRSVMVFVTALAYAAANLFLLVGTISIDKFAIFSTAYGLLVGIVGPGIVWGAVFCFAGFVKKLSWLSVVGLSLWAASVGFAHVWLVAQISASV